MSPLSLLLPVEARGYYRRLAGRYWEFVQAEKCPDLAGHVEKNSARVHFLRDLGRRSFPTPPKPAKDRVHRVQKGRKYAYEHDGKNDDQRDAFVREHGGLLL
jgi:hypothetical protein